MNDVTRFNKIVSLAQSGQEIKDAKKLENLILTACDFQLKMNALTAWVIGKYLTDLKALVGHGKFLKFLENEKFPYSRRTASKYMLLYQFHKESPTGIEEMGVTDAMKEAGIIEPKGTSKNWNKLKKSWSLIFRNV